MKDKWVIFWDSGSYSKRLCSHPKQVVKETEKLIKFSRSGGWPRQIDKSDFIAAFDSQADASEALDKAQAGFKAAYDLMSSAVNDANKAHTEAVAARAKAVLYAVSQAVSASLQNAPLR